jgi:hypothetical protein
MSFRDEAKVRQTVRRGNGLMTCSELETLQVAIDIGRGRLLLRLSKLQYSSLIRSAEGCQQTCLRTDQITVAGERS